MQDFKINLNIAVSYIINEGERELKNIPYNQNNAIRMIEEIS